MAHNPGNRGSGEFPKSVKMISLGEPKSLRDVASDMSNIGDHSAKVLFTGLLQSTEFHRFKVLLLAPNRSVVLSKQPLLLICPTVS